MQFTSDHSGRAAGIAALFEATFTASEGPDEGHLIGDLARNLLETTPQEDLHVFLALDDNDIAGCIIFSRLSYDEDDRTVFVLAPVAVATERQGMGIGQELLKYGLGQIRDEGVDVAVTYGDPAYYGKVGFAPITEVEARAPFTLRLPHGWLGQSLTDRPLEPLKGPSRCVAALDRPEFW